jgi:hypothetical protein
MLASIILSMKCVSLSLSHSLSRSLCLPMVKRNMALELIFFNTMMNGKFSLKKGSDIRMDRKKV